MVLMLVWLPHWNLHICNQFVCFIIFSFAYFIFEIQNGLWKDD